MASTSAARVSVVIPAYNASQTLDEQLEALSRQRIDRPWEVLVCDNGSTDDTAAVAMGWSDRLPSVRVIDASARRGPSAAMNTGAGVSAAEYLVFCDADDVVADGWLAEFVAALDRAPYVGGHVEYDLLRAPGSTSVSWSDTGPFVFSLPVLPQLAGTGSGNFGIHRALYEEVGGFEEALQTCEDADFSWRIQLAGYPLSICPAMYHVRTRQTLRGIARQSYNWGAGQVTLRYRYAKVIAAIAALEGASGAAGAPAGGGRRSLGSRLAGGMRRVLRGQTRTLAANTTWQLGHRLGRRFGRADLSVEQVEPPADLGAILARVRETPWVALGARSETA